MASTLEQSLGTVLQRELPGFQSLQSCEQLTAGASQETYRLTLQTDDGSRHLALRRMQPNLSQASSVGTILPDTEARLFQLATAAGIPGPGVVYILQPSDALGNGFLMDWLQGETLGQRVVRSEALAGVRPRLARQCGEILGGHAGGERLRLGARRCDDGARCNGVRGRLEPLGVQEVVATLPGRGPRAHHGTPGALALFPGDRHPRARRAHRP